MQTRAGTASDNGLEGEAGDLAGRLFTRPEYLEPLERCGCASPQTGWTSAPLRSAAGSAPCYEKAHSWGEFVFDFEFAAAYEQRGLRYYPKLVCCVPFTPVSGPRLLARDNDGKAALAAALTDAAASRRCSGAHILFLPREDAELLEPLGWLPRRQLRYVWRNAGYAGFDEFLARLSSKKRRNIRRERAALAQADLEISWCAGAELSPTRWRQVFELYASTYRLRGQPPYLNLDCLRAWAENFSGAMQFCLAQRGGKLLAMAFYFREGGRLYGRHWGAQADIPGLHFELCYYQGIDYCIRHGLQHFDSGVQGEHRLLRGFEPEFSYSAHWFAHAGFRAAIARVLERERAALDAHLELAREHSAFKQATY